MRNNYILELCFAEYSFLPFMLKCNPILPASSTSTDKIANKVWEDYWSYTSNVARVSYVLTWLSFSWRLLLGSIHFKNLGCLVMELWLGNLKLQNHLCLLIVKDAANILIQHLMISSAIVSSFRIYYIISKHYQISTKWNISIRN